MWRKSRRACEAREIILTACGSVSPQSPSLFSASFQTFCLTFLFRTWIRKNTNCFAERDEYLFHNKINISLLHHTNYLHKRCFGSGLKSFGLTKGVASNSDRHFSQRWLPNFRGNSESKFRTRWSDNRGLYSFLQIWLNSSSQLYITRSVLRSN